VPDILCVGDAVSADLTNSYVPLGTLDSWTVDWGDGTNNAGAGVPGVVNKAAAYAAAGVYDVYITVTDNGPPASTGSLTVQILVVDCAAGRVLADYMYLISQTTGPWLRDMTVLEDVPPGVPTWVQHATGLAGRHLPVAGRHVWIATQGGVAKSTDNMDHWTMLYDFMNDPRDTALDMVPPTKAGLNWVAITFNPLVRDEVYVLAYDTVAPIRSFVYFTHDGGVTWDNWECCF